MTDEKPTLLPCPFCGKPPHMMVNTAVDCGYVVQCVSTDCIMRSHYFHLDAWERRAQPPDLAAKWLDRTRSGYAFELFAERDGNLYGRYEYKGRWIAGIWTGLGTSTAAEDFDLIPRSKHVDLIEEVARIGQEGGYLHHILAKRIIDALEQEQS